MITNDITVDRIARANDVYEDLVRMDQLFLTHMKNHKRKWMLSLNLVSYLLLFFRITKFEHEGAKLLTILADMVDFNVAHDLLCEFNELLNDFKPTFIEYMDLARLNPAEDSTDLFNVYTYGGEV